MIESRLQAHGRITIPPAVRKALGLMPGDRLRYEIAGDRVTVSRIEQEPGTTYTDAEMDAIIDEALVEAEKDPRTYSADEVFAELHERIEALSGRKDAA